MENAYTIFLSFSLSNFFNNLPFENADAPPLPLLPPALPPWGSP